MGRKRKIGEGKEKRKEELHSPIVCVCLKLHIYTPKEISISKAVQTGHLI